MFGIKRKTPEEKIIELAEKYDFEVYRKKGQDHSYYLVSDTYERTPTIENKIFDKAEKLKVKLITFIPGTDEQKPKLGKRIYKHEN